MTKKNHEEALAEFRASHDIVASPNTRLEIARCLETMGRLVEAYAELGRTAVEAKEMKAEDKRYERAYDAAVTERALLKPKLGFVSLTIENPSEDTRVIVGGEEIRPAAWAEPAPVLAGTTTIVVRTPGHAPVERSVALAAGASTALALDAQSGAPNAVASPVASEPAAEIRSIARPFEHGPTSPEGSARPGWRRSSSRAPWLARRTAICNEPAGPPLVRPTGAMKSRPGERNRRSRTSGSSWESSAPPAGRRCS